MNVNDGHLLRLASIVNQNFGEEEARQQLAAEMAALEKRGYTPVPEDLEGAAKKKLAGRLEAYVSLTSGGKLSRWAAKQRKAKRKMVAQSRKRNRP